MTHIKEVLKAIKPSSDIAIAFKSKSGLDKITDQDKKHVRIMAIIQLARDRELMNYIINHDFKESFTYDKEKNLLVYRIRFIKERSVKYRGDC